MLLFFFFFNDTATTEIYTLSLHDALPILTESILTSISPQECGLLDAMGIKYFGPINGHNIGELIDTFNYMKCIDGPKFVHVKTVKGKGYRYAEQCPENYHGVGSFDYKIGIQESSKV